MIFLIFIFIPIIEISIFILIGSEIGVLNTIAIILLTALVGIYLVRKQGLSLLFNAQCNMSQGIFPLSQLVMEWINYFPPYLEFPAPLLKVLLFSAVHGFQKCMSF